MSVGTNPLLLIMIGLPLIGGLVLVSMRGAGARATRTIALLIALAEIVLAAILWVDYRNFQTSGSTARFDSVFSVDWIPSFGIRFSVGVDGFALVMIALIAVLVPIVLGASWEERLPAGRTVPGYFALILTLEA